MTNILDLTDRRNMFYWQVNRKITAIQDKDIFLDRHIQVDLNLVKKAAEVGMKKAGFSGDDVVINQVHPIIPRGLINTVVPVLLKSGREVILRMHPKGVKNGYFWVEKAATALVTKENVPTYQTIIVDDSRDDVPFDYMIMTKVAGRPMQDLWPLSPALDEVLVTETGRYSALIHRVNPKGYGFFLNIVAKEKNIVVGQYETFKEHMFAALEEDLRFLEEFVVITKGQRKKIEFIIRKREDLMVCQKPSLIHNDIADWNVLTDGIHVSGMMDWDECFSGDPLMELAAYSLFFGEPRLQWYKNGYREGGVLEENEDKYQLFKLRYLVSKLHLRKKRSTVDDSPQLKRNLKRGLEAMGEVFAHFKV